MFFIFCYYRQCNDCHLLYFVNYDLMTRALTLMIGRFIKRKKGQESKIMSVEPIK